MRPLGWLLFALLFVHIVLGDVKMDPIWQGPRGLGSHLQAVDQYVNPSLPHTLKTDMDITAVTVLL